MQCKLVFSLRPYSENGCMCRCAALDTGPHVTLQASPIPLPAPLVQNHSSTHWDQVFAAPQQGPRYISRTFFNTNTLPISVVSLALFFHFIPYSRARSFSVFLFLSAWQPNIPSRHRGHRPLVPFCSKHRDAAQQNPAAFSGRGLGASVNDARRREGPGLLCETPWYTHA